MNRTKLSENLSQLNETEVDILTYVTKQSIDWFNDLTNPDDKVEYALKIPFSYYANTENHPMNKVYNKIIDGIFNKELFKESDLNSNDESFNDLAKKINKIYNSSKHREVLIILKAIGERDFNHIIKSQEYSDELTLEEFLQDFEEKYINDVVDWMAKYDLKTILMFCEYN